MVKFMDLPTWSESTLKASRIERFPTVYDFPDVEEPSGDFSVPTDFSSMSYKDLVNLLQQLAGHESSANYVETQYAACEEYYSKKLKDAEAQAYKRHFPHGKPKDKTVAEVERIIYLDDEVSELREHYDAIKVAHVYIKGVVSYLSKTTGRVAQMLKYMQTTGDRSPNYRTDAEDFGWE